jgi:hypothetical protein
VLSPSTTFEVPLELSEAFDTESTGSVSAVAAVLSSSTPLKAALVGSGPASSRAWHSNRDFLRDRQIIETQTHTVIMRNVKKNTKPKRPDVDNEKVKEIEKSQRHRGSRG